jgi:hypothetical protein
MDTMSSLQPKSPEHKNLNHTTSTTTNWRLLSSTTPYLRMLDLEKKSGEQFF